MQRQIIIDVSVEPGTEINEFEITLAVSGTKSGVIKEVDPCDKVTANFAALLAGWVQRHGIISLASMALSCEPETVEQFLKASIRDGIPLLHAAEQNIESSVMCRTADGATIMEMKIKELFLIKG